MDKNKQKNAAASYEVPAMCVLQYVETVPLATSSVSDIEDFNIETL